MTNAAPQSNDVAARPAAMVGPPKGDLSPTDGDAISTFASGANFSMAQRMALALCSSTIVPEAYRGEENLANCIIALEIASRVGASVMMVMQSLDIIHGRPSWRANFLIATVNSSGKFTPLRYRWEGKPGDDVWGARCFAKSKEDGEECPGALITIGLAKSEGWYDRKGSKWRSMPEQMIMYRAAAFWTRVYCPELALGMQTADEVIDTVGETVVDSPKPADAPKAAARMSAADLEARLRERSPDAPGEKPKPDAPPAAEPPKPREPGEEG